MAAGGFDNDDVGHRAEDGEVAGERRGQCHHFPHQLRLLKSGNPFAGDEDKRDVGKNVRAERREPGEVPCLSRCRLAKHAAQSRVNLVGQTRAVQSFDNDEQRGKEE